VSAVAFPTQPSGGDGDSGRKGGSSASMDARAANPPSTAWGFMLAFVGVLVLTTDTLMIRLGADGNPDVNKWAIVFYRYFFHGIACGVVNFVWMRQGILLELIKTGRLGVLAILMFSSCNISFTMSVQSESPATQPVWGGPGPAMTGPAMTGLARKKLLPLLCVRSEALGRNRNQTTLRSLRPIVASLHPQRCKKHRVRSLLL
jgi:hypothetical protein